MKKYFLSIATVLLCMPVCSQVVKVYQTDGGIPTVFRSPASVVFAADKVDETYSSEDSKEDATRYVALPGSQLGSTTTTTNLAVNLNKLLSVADVKHAVGLNSVKIEPAEFEEIKEFTINNIVKGKTTNLDKMKAILAWCKNNIKYMTVPPEYNPDIDPNWAYQTFKNRTAVCQGYANLCTVMLESQGIPAAVANGYLVSYGHAWVYAMADGVWYVIDPTNDATATYKASSTSSYASKLIPCFLDMTLFEDDCCVYSFDDKMLNIDEVKFSEDAVFSVPYSARGYFVQSFNPKQPLPSNVREIYLHKNIQSIGEYVDGLNRYGTQLYNVYVEDSNPSFCDYDGCVYRLVNKVPSELLYIPGAKKSVRVAPMKTVGKNTILDRETIEELFFDVTSVEFEDYAVESCPNVRKIHIAKDARYSAKSFYGVHKDCEILEDVM